MENDTRYPYTYAADYIRSIAGHGDHGSTKLSRSDASQIRKAISVAIGMDDHLLAAKIADHYLKEKEKLSIGNI